MSIKANTKDIVIPSEERHIKMFPLDFEEFLWALDNQLLMDFIRQSFQEHKPMGQALHRKAMDYFRQYLVVGECRRLFRRMFRLKILNALTV